MRPKKVTAELSVDNPHQYRYDSGAMKWREPGILKRKSKKLYATQSNMAGG
jgi:hypothetical protein